MSGYSCQVRPEQGAGKVGAFPLTLTLSPEGRGDRIVQILLPQQQTGSYSPPNPFRVMAGKVQTLPNILQHRLHVFTTTAIRLGRPPRPSGERVGVRVTGGSVPAE